MVLLPFPSRGWPQLSEEDIILSLPALLLLSRLFLQKDEEKNALLLTLHATEV